MDGDVGEWHGGRGGRHPSPFKLGGQRGHVVGPVGEGCSPTQPFAVPVDDDCDECMQKRDSLGGAQAIACAIILLWNCGTDDDADCAEHDGRVTDATAA